MLQFLVRICRFNFGNFVLEEFKKFLHLGLIFVTIIGVYWTLRPIKDSLFIQLVDKMQLPYAKSASVLGLLPLVILYTKLLERTSREKMFILLPGFYGIGILCFGGVIFIAYGSPEEIATRSVIGVLATKALGYFWYLFVESFGSIVVALFWAYSIDTTEPISAKKGFPLVVTIGQIGGIILPYSIAGLPYRLGLTTDTLSIIILGILTLLIIPLFRSFLRHTPEHLLTTFQGEIDEHQDNKQKSVFFEGLKLVCSHKYLIGIFCVNFIYEFITTIFDFNFLLKASTHYSGVVLSHYLSIYSSSVNIVSLLCLLMGISNIMRFLGVGAALAAMPIIISLALFSFLTLDSLTFLFSLMVGSKAIHYALNGPALKQLYIPTSTDAHFKAQAWIETFGERSSKQVGSVFNMILRPLQNIFGEIVGRAHYLILSGVIGFPLLVLWFIIALYLGRAYRKAINDKKLVC